MKKSCLFMSNTFPPSPPFPIIKNHFGVRGFFLKNIHPLKLCFELNDLEVESWC